MSDIIPYDPGSITKRGNDKTLFPLPNVADDGSRLCVRVNIPNIPAHRQAFIGAIYNLTRWYSWGQDEAHSAKGIATVWKSVFTDMMAHFYDGCDDCPPEEKCIDYPTDSGVLSYFPTNPFTDPDTIPNQFYNKPPFYILSGDVITDISVPSANPLDLPYLALTELPRIRINVTGDKLVRIHMLSVIQGGYASIVTDDNVLTTEWVDLTRASLLDFQAILQAIQEGLGVGTLNGVLFDEVITEIKLTTTGSHHIDIIFWPKFNTEVIVGFGGGLRKVEICGNEICDMGIESIRIDGCNLQMTYDGTEWVTVGDLTDCAVPGPQGLPGVDGQDGANGADGATGATGAPGAKGDKGDPGKGGSDYTPPETDDTAVLCGIATYLTNWHDALWRNYLDAAFAEASVGAAAAAAVATVVATPVVGVVVQFFTSLVADAFTAGILALEAAVTPTALEDVQCWLYCELKANGYGADTIQNWHDKIIAESGANVGLQYWANGLLGITQDSWDFRANIGVLTPSATCEALCDDCPDEPTAFCWEFDFTADAFPVSAAISGYGVHVPGEGWQVPYFPGYDQLDAVFACNWTTLYPITRVEMDVFTEVANCRINAVHIFDIGEQTYNHDFTGDLRDGLPTWEWLNDSHNITSETKFYWRRLRIYTASTPMSFAYGSGC